MRELIIFVVISLVSFGIAIFSTSQIIELAKPKPLVIGIIE